MNKRFLSPNKLEQNTKQFLPLAMVSKGNVGPYSCWHRSFFFLNSAVLFLCVFKTQNSDFFCFIDHTCMPILPTSTWPFPFFCLTISLQLSLNNDVLLKQLMLRAFMQKNRKILKDFNPSQLKNYVNIWLRMYWTPLFL